MERSPVKVEAELSYEGLRGLELLEAVHRAGKAKRDQLSPTNDSYVGAVCHRAGVEYPDEFYDSDVQEIWARRCQAIGYRES